MTYTVKIETSFIVVADSEEQALQDALLALGESSENQQYYVEVKEVKSWQ